VRMNKYIINLLCTRQALQILLQVAATRVVLVYNTQARHAITKRSNLVTEIRAVALLSRVLCCLFEGPSWGQEENGYGGDNTTLS